MSDRRGEVCGGCCGTSRQRCFGDANEGAATTATQGAAVKHWQLQHRIKMILTIFTTRTSIIIESGAVAATF